MPHGCIAHGSIILCQTGWIRVLSTDCSAVPHQLNCGVIGHWRSMPPVAEVWGKPRGHPWLLWTVVATSESWKGNCGCSSATHSAENAAHVKMIMYENARYVKLDLKRFTKWWQGSEMGTVHVQLLSRGWYSGACTTYKRMYLEFEQVFRWFRTRNRWHNTAQNFASNLLFLCLGPACCAYSFRDMMPKRSNVDWIGRLACIHKPVH